MYPRFHLQYIFQKDQLNEQLRGKKIKGVLETSYIHKILPSAVADLFYILLKRQKIKTKTNNLEQNKETCLPRQIN